MATLTNTIKKANKITGQQFVKVGMFYTYKYKGYEVSFSQNGSYDQATGFYTRRIGLNDDLMTDYFAGTFHENITKAFKFIDYIAK